MIRPRTIFVFTLAAATLAALAPQPVFAQEQYQYETELVAKGRVFKSVGDGFREIRRGPGGTYYILTAPAPVLFIYNEAGQRIGQVPARPDAKDAALMDGLSFDVDRNGRVAVNDRGANSVKVYDAAGALLAAFPVPNALSVAMLGPDEIAVVTPNLSKLVTVYNFSGKVVRDFGDPEEISDTPEINQQGNFGHLLSDASGNAYFAFDYLPEPTIRKFDPAGHMSTEISLTTIEFQGAAQSARRAIARSENAAPAPPALHRIITAMGVDPESQEVWLAIGTLLMEFDKDGKRLASFRTYLRDGVRLEGRSILVEPTRLYIGNDPMGIYEFVRPARNSQ
jgi:hypothetical protein